MQASNTRSGRIYKVVSMGNDNKDGTSNITVSPSLPAFSETNPRAWFKLAESRFTVSNITTDDGKSSRVLEALPPPVFQRLAPWLEKQPDDTTDYLALKAELLSYFVSSKPRRAQQILDLVTKPSDDSPSARWRKIDALHTNADGSRIDLGWELWLNSLPPQVKVAMQDTEMKDRDAAIKRADTLVHLTEQNPSSWPSASAVSQDKQRKERKRLGPKDDEIQDGMCWYHRSFGDRAHRCLTGCKHYKPQPAKNANSGHQ